MCEIAQAAGGGLGEWAVYWQGEGIACKIQKGESSKCGMLWASSSKEEGKEEEESKEEEEEEEDELMGSSGMWAKAKGKGCVK